VAPDNRELQQSPGSQQQAQTQGPQTSTAGVQALQHTLASGKPPVATVIGILDRFPDDRDAIMVELQQSLGNSYVQEVMVAQQKPEHQSWWRAAAQGTADAATLLYELDRITTFHPFKGTFEGTVDLSAALRVAQLVVPKDKLPAIALGQTPNGSNKVFLELSVYHKFADLTAPQLQIAGFANASMITGPAVLQGLHAHGTTTNVDVTFANAKFQHVTFIRGNEHLSATELQMTGLRASEANGKQGAIAFTGAQVHGLQYPNAPAVDFDMPGGASMDAVWTHTAGPTPAKAATPEGLPAVPDVLPQGSKIAIELVGAHGSANGAGGAGGFEHLHAAVVQGSRDLASLDISGFTAAGGTANASASIRQLSIIGDPALVKQLLEHPQIAGNPSVKSAVDLAKSAGLDPAIGGKIVANNVTINHTAGGEEAKGDFAGQIAVPQIGTLDFNLTGVSATAKSTSEMAAQFATMKLTLRDNDHKELAYLELDGGQASMKGAAHAGQVRQLAARGDLGKLVSAADPIVKHAPIDIRGALQALKSLGVKGSVTGDLTASTEGKEATFGGDFNIDLDAGKVGSVKMHVGGMHGNESGALSFASFTATLTDTHGKQAASIAIEGAASTPETKGNENATHAKKISARGEDATVTSMIAAIQAQTSTLPAPVKAAFAMVRRFYANAGGSLTLENASMGLDKAGDSVAKAADVQGSFELHGAGSAAITLTGFRGVNSKSTSTISFTEFAATLTDPTGKKAARVTVEGSHDTFGPNASDFHVDAKSVHIEGESKQAAALFSGMQAHLSTLPQPIAASFKLIEQYVGTIDAEGSVDVTNAAVSSKKGDVVAHGNISGRVKLTEGELDATLTNARTEAGQLGFDGLDVAIKDPHGANAATLHAANAAGDMAKKTGSLGDLSIHGDPQKLKQILDPAVQRVLPPQIGKVLAMLDQSQFEVGTTNLNIAETPGRGLGLTANTITAAGTIQLSDKSGQVYTARNARLEFDGANVVMDAKGEPREIDATAIAISGNFSSVGGGDALRGDVVVKTGKATVKLDDHGAPIAVEVQNIHASGDANRTTTPGKPAPQKQPTRDQKLAALDGETQSAESIAQSIRSADIRARVPLFAGRYGHGLSGIGVPVGAAINIAVEVRNNALTNETSVHIAPPLDLPLWLTGKGVDLETKGREGALKLRLGGFFDQNITKYVIGKGPLALDLPSLVAEVTNHMRDGILSAHEPSSADEQKDAAKDAAKEAKDEAKLDKDHASWERDRDRDVSRGANQKKLDKDAMAEPRGASAADIATHGIDVPHSSATADLTLAKPDGTLSGHLHGAANGGGRLALTADELQATVDGQHFDAKGVDTGVVDVATGSEGASSVQLHGLSIADFKWSR
jgi:hypothetical protein